MFSRLRVLLLALPLFIFFTWSGWPLPYSERALVFWTSSSDCDAVQNATTRGGARLEEAQRGGLSCTLKPIGESTLEKVARVVDGDTIVLQDGSRVRYVGLDTPEIGEKAEFYGQEATETNRRLVEGRQVRLERDVSDKDRYGRFLRYVYSDGILVNAELVREGYARAVSYPPDIRYQKCLEGLEEEARAARRGIWSR
ncbi:MAG: thermonuclease family protein [Chloroflexi bacterium]|nr:thermonuclease family protein [Chloroflexota bacterium]